MKILITGGAGFIGSNCADYYAKKGNRVYICDNLSRNGSKYNLNFLLEKHPNIKFFNIDISDTRKVNNFFKENSPFSLIIHLAAQTAVTTSITDPQKDFRTNALSSLNLLEAIRYFSPKSYTIYSSTNKVYGELSSIPLKSNKIKYLFTGNNNSYGIDETQPLDFHSPYGCSKGSADQYFIDYSRIYDLKTVVFRQSCIYGYNQFGKEDQGWVAWFIISFFLKKNIIIFGNGKQTRDILFIDDLVRLYDLAYKKKVLGAFNIGGGNRNALSLLELINLLEKKLGWRIPIIFKDSRPGDQKIFIADIGKAKKLIGWEPLISKDQGINLLIEWVKNNLNIIKSVYE